MTEALYGPAGFYRRPNAPAGHFRTAAHTSPLWGAAMARLAERVAQDVQAMTIVEIGAGGGELLSSLAALGSKQWRLVGVDVCPRPPSLPQSVEWADAVPGSFDGLLLAVEWLDVVPVDVVERTEDGVRVVEVSTDGRERLGARPDGADAAWLRQWWPLAEVGDRAEVGRSRDEAWADAVARLRRGVAVAVDYAADPRRDVEGTLTGYRDGRQVVPMPAGSCDLTAHVLIESCASAVDGVTTCVTSQRDALRALGVSATRPPYDGGDVHGYLRALQQVGEAAELLDPDGLGEFTWLLQARGVPLPIEV
jgi:SAM-dependent MidA family methyltransferase